jgi:hypothetical protein
MRAVILAIAVTFVACNKSEPQLDVDALCAKYLERSVACSSAAPSVGDEKTTLENAMRTSCKAALTDTGTTDDVARKHRAAERAAVICVANAADCAAARACYERT